MRWKGNKRYIDGAQAINAFKGDDHWAVITGNGDESDIKVCLLGEDGQTVKNYKLIKIEPLKTLDARIEKSKGEIAMKEAVLIKHFGQQWREKKKKLDPYG